jgi:hypothetical protein
MTPASLRFFRNYGIALAVVSALIWFPVTGFFLTFLTLGLLPSLICNAFLIHLAYAAWTKKFPRAWLAVPIACYGAWLGWAVLKNWDTYREKSQLESENHVTGSIPQSVTLVFPEGDLEIARRAKRHLAPSVRVFDGSIELSAIKANEMLCMLSKPNDPPSMQKFRCPTEPISQPPADAIVFRQLERPDPHSKSRIYFHRYELTQRSGSTGDAVAGHFNFGRLSAPVWAPVFVAGCFLIDNPAAWLCDISPKLRRVAVGETGYPSEDDPWEEKSDPVIATLANMLGIKYVADDARP